MLKKNIPKPVELEIRKHRIRFNSVEDFEFALNGRTSIPAPKISEMVHLSSTELNDEALTIKNVETFFVSIIANFSKNPEGIDRELKETEPLVFSQDHAWRDIMAALNAADELLIEFKHIAVVKYLQYLSARQYLINFLHSEKNKPTSTTITDSMTIESEIYHGSADLNSATLDMVRAYHGQQITEDMERMPKGERVLIHLLKDKGLDLILSKYKCKLVGGDIMKFIDHDGNEYPLKEGKNIIGRDAICNIMMEQFLRDVSRVHLVVVKKERASLELTDLSSHGTYIPSKYFVSSETV